MALNISQTFRLLNELNFTANCTVAEAWREKHPWNPSGNSVDVGTSNDSLNLDFISMAWPRDFQLGNKSQIGSFYDIISRDIPSDWKGKAFDSIDTGCLGPSLAQKVAFENLNFTRDCLTASQHYGKYLCATADKIIPGDIHSPDAIPGFPVEKYLMRYLFFAGSISELDSPNGVAMLRESWPYSTDNVSNASLAEWGRIKMIYNDIEVLEPSQQYLDYHAMLQNMCRSCIREFCTAAGYVGNVDIAGIGVLVSYILASTIVTLHPIMYGISRMVPLREFLFFRAVNYAVENIESQKLLKDTTWFFMFSLAIAFIISIKGKPPLSKTFYETSVATSALYLAVSVYLAVLFFNLSASDRSQKYRFATGGFLCVIILGYVISVKATILHLGSNSGQGDWPCFGDRLKKFGGTGTYFYATVMGISLLGFSVWWIIVLLARIHWIGGSLAALRRHQSRTMRYFRGQDIPPQRTTRAFFVFRALLTAAFLIIAWVETAYIIALRNTMHSFPKTTVVEDDWGYGQVLAVLLWLPLITDFGFRIIKGWKGLRGTVKVREKADEIPVGNLSLVPGTLPDSNDIIPRHRMFSYIQGARTRDQEEASCQERDGRDYFYANGSAEGGDIALRTLRMTKAI